MNENQNNELKLESERIGKNKVRITARLNSEPVHIDTLDPSSATNRQRFVKALADKVPVTKS
jgi:hypothetical protein